MGDAENRKLVERMWELIAAHEMKRAAELLHDDFVEDWPQSGERIRGRDNWLMIATAHPTFPDVKVVSTDGVGDLWATQAHFEYPMEEGPAPYEVCSVQWIRDGRIARIVEYFGAPFEAPAWRAQWVERIQ